MSERLGLLVILVFVMVLSACNGEDITPKTDVGEPSTQVVESKAQVEEPSSEPDDSKVDGVPEQANTLEEKGEENVGMDEKTEEERLAQETGNVVFNDIHFNFDTKYTISQSQNGVIIFMDDEKKGFGPKIVVSISHSPNGVREGALEAERDEWLWYFKQDGDEMEQVSGTIAGVPSIGAHGTVTNEDVTTIEKFEVFATENDVYRITLSCNADNPGAPAFVEEYNKIHGSIQFN